MKFLFSKKISREGGAGGGGVVGGGGGGQASAPRASELDVPLQND